MARTCAWEATGVAKRDRLARMRGAEGDRGMDINKEMTEKAMSSFSSNTDETRVHTWAGCHIRVDDIQMAFPVLDTKSWLSTRV